MKGFVGDRERLPCKTFVDPLADKLSIHCDGVTVGGKVARRVSHLTKMGQKKPLGQEAGEFVEAGEGLLEVELRRSRSHGEVGASPETGSRRVAGEDRAADREGVMVEGVSRSVVRRHGESRDFDRIPVSEGFDPLGRSLGETSPETVKAILIDAAGAFEETSRVDEVARTARVDMDIDATGGKPTRGTSVVEMDVGDEKAA